MNYHSHLNTIVMSTVFKLKAALLLVCALLIVNVTYGRINLSAGYDYLAAEDPNAATLTVSGGTSIASDATEITVTLSGLGYDWSYRNLFDASGNPLTSLGANSPTASFTVDVSNFSSGANTIYLYKTTDSYPYTTKTGSALASVTITKAAPAPELVVNPSTSSICAGGSVSILLKNVDGTTYPANNWVIRRDGTKITPTFQDGNYTAIISNATAGEYIVEVEGLSASFTVVSDTHKDRDLTFCNTDVYQVNATLPEGFTGKWAGAVDDITSPTTTINVPKGEHTYTWEYTNGSCTYVEKWKLTNNTPSLELSTNDLSNCGSAKITATYPSSFTPTWTVDGVTNSSTSNVLNLSNLSIGDHVVTCKIGKTAECTVTKSVTVTNTSSVDLGEGETITLCDGDNTVNLNATSVPGAKCYWSTTGSGTFYPSSTNPNVTVSGLSENETTVFTWNVEVPNCEKKTVTYKVHNGIHTVIPTGDVLLCGKGKGDVASIGISHSISNSDYKVVWTAITRGASIQEASNASSNSNLTSVTAVMANNAKVNQFKYSVSSTNNNLSSCNAVEGIISVTSVVATAEIAGKRPADGEQAIVICGDETINLKGNNVSSLPAGSYGEWTANGTNVASIANPSANNTSATLLADKGVSFTWTIYAQMTTEDGETKSCTSSAVTPAINRDVTVIEDADFCTDNGTATISLDVPAGVTGSWTKVSGGKNTEIASASSVSTKVSNLDAGISSFRWRGVTANGCSTNVATAYVYNIDQVSAPTIGKPYVCDINEPVSLTANNPSPATGEWSFAQGGGTFANQTSNHTTFTLDRSSDGKSVIKWTTSYETPISKEKCSTSKTVDIYNLHVDATAGDDIEICNYDNANTLKTEGLDEATLSATAVPTTTPASVGTWSSKSGATIESSSSATTKVTNLQAGANEFVWTVVRKSDDGKMSCSASDVVVVYNSKVGAALAGDDQVVCSDFVQLQATKAENGIGYWKLEAGEGVFNSEGNETVEVKTYQNDFEMDGFNYRVTTEVQAEGTDNESISRTFYQAVSEVTTEETYTEVTDQATLTQIQELLKSAAPISTTDEWVGTYTHKVTEKFNITFGGKNYVVSAVNTITYDPTTGVSQGNNMSYIYQEVGTRDVVTVNYQLVTDGTLRARMLEKITNTNGTINNGQLVSTNNSVITKVINPRTTVTGLQKGLNTFRWVVSKGVLAEEACLNYDLVNIYYLPVDVDAGETQQLCENHGNLQGYANTDFYANVPDLSWKVEWTTSQGGNASIQNTSAFESFVSGLTPGKNYFTLTVYAMKDLNDDGVIDQNKEMCSNHDDVLIWNDEVGPVDAGEDVITCGDDYYGEGNDHNFHDYVGNYRNLKATTTTSLRSEGVVGHWSVVGGGVGTVKIDNPNSNVTSVSNLQKYVQECRPDYWDNYTVANQFEWTLTYTNSETNHVCQNSDTVQVIWLAPQTPNAGADQFACGNEVNLNALDQGCGAQMNWWLQSGSSTTGGNNNITLTNPYWGGNATLNDYSASDLTAEEISDLKQSYGDLDFKSKEVVVYTDVANLDDTYYSIKSTRTIYWDSKKETVLHVDKATEIHTCNSDGTNVSTEPATVSEGTQLALYQIADEIYNAAVHGMPTGGAETTYRWYKHNEMFDVAHNKLVSCTSWDEVKVKAQGLLQDCSGSKEQVICNDYVELNAADGCAVFDSGNGNNYRTEIVSTQWSVVHGNGDFDDPSAQNTIVRNLAFDTNVLRWTVTMDVYLKENGGHEEQVGSCTATDDAYITNAQPSHAALGKDREICQSTTPLSANIPVRSTRTEWIVEQGGGLISNVSCNDQQCDAYAYNLGFGPNTFSWNVYNFYRSPKNPEAYAECKTVDYITYYNHGIPADAGLDQYICSDSVVLSGNDPKTSGSLGSFKDEFQYEMHIVYVTAAGGETTDVAKAKLDANGNPITAKDSNGDVKLECEKDENGACIIKYPMDSYWTQGTSSTQSFYNFDDPSIVAQGGLHYNKVYVKPLSRNMNTFYWNVSWGGCADIDTVKVYDNLPQPDPDAGPDRYTCDNTVTLTPNSKVYEGEMEWTSSVDQVTFDGDVNKTSDQNTTIASNLKQGVDNTFTLTYYRKNSDAKHPGFAPIYIGEYERKVEEYKQSQEDYFTYLEALAQYNIAKNQYDIDIEEYNTCVAAWETYAHDPLSNEVPNCSRVKPSAPVAPKIPAAADPSNKNYADTSSTNTQAPWSGKGLWKYYVDLSAAYIEAHYAENSINAPICRLSDNVIVHSNFFTASANDLSLCDYYVPDYTTFVTCTNKTDTLRKHPYGAKHHDFQTISLSFLGGTHIKVPNSEYASNASNMESIRNDFKRDFISAAKSKAESVTDPSTIYGVLWTMVSGEKTLTIDDVQSPAPKVSDALDGKYVYEAFVVRYDGSNGACTDTAKVTLAIHLPTPAYLEAQYQGIGDWTLDRTAMCQDNVNLQWASATGTTFTPADFAEGGTATGTLEPGKVNGGYNGTQGKEYSILRVANNDQNGADVTFARNSYAGGMTSYKVGALPYNATNLEVINCIDYITSEGAEATCISADTITVFNNSVYADADVRIAPDKSFADYEWARQDTNICTDEYELQANDPKAFDGNATIYHTQGMWGYDDKDFKGFNAALLDPVFENSLSYNTKVSGLKPSDGHQRANGLIWCVYKSIMPPECKLETPTENPATSSDGVGIPLKSACTPDKNCYERDANGNVLYYDEDGNTYVESVNEKGGVTYLNTATGEEVGRGVTLMPNELEILQGQNGCYAYDAIFSPHKCLKFYDLEELNKYPKYAEQMKVINTLNFMMSNNGENNGGRSNWNFYVTEHKDYPEYLFFWSDRQTTGQSVNGNTAYCRLKGTDTWENRYYQYHETWSNPGHYFKGAVFLPLDQSADPWVPTFYDSNNSWFTSKYDVCRFNTYDGGLRDNYPWGWNGVEQVVSANEAKEQLKYSKIDANGNHLNGVSVSEGGYYEKWSDVIKTVSGTKDGKDACSANVQACIYYWAVWGWGQPARIPKRFLAGYEDGTWQNIVTTTNPKSATRTNFAKDKGVKAAHNNSALSHDVPLLGDGDQDGVSADGWTAAWHVTGIKFDEDAIKSYISEFETELADYSTKTREPLVSTATTVDEIKEEAENQDKHFWCVARDTVFVYDNRFNIANMPNFVVCEDNVQLLGEEPGSALAADGAASGKWTIKTNDGSAQFASDDEDTKFNARVTDLPAGETVFNWHVERWGCTDDDEVIVYYNKVESDAGEDVVVCDDFAQLQAVQPTVGRGHWELTTGSATGTLFGESSDDANAALYDPEVDYTEDGVDQGPVMPHGYALNLKQEDNLFKWVVENPFPEYDEEGALMQFNNHDYLQQESCPVEDEMTVINNRPDDPEVGAASVEGCQDPSTNALDNTYYVTLQAKQVEHGHGHWEYDSGAEGGIISSPFQYSTTIDKLPLGKSVYRWVVENGGGQWIVYNSTTGEGHWSKATFAGGKWVNPPSVCSKAVTMTVINNFIKVDVNQTTYEVCENKVDLKAGDPKEQYQKEEDDVINGWWSVVSQEYKKTLDFTSDSPNTTVSNLGYNVTNMRWNVSKGMCSDQIDVTITNNEVEAKITKPAEDDSHIICTADGLKLDAKEQRKGVEGNWSITQAPNTFTIPDASVTFTAPTGYTTTANGLSEAGSYTINWHVSKGICYKDDAIVITNNSFTVDADNTKEGDENNIYVCGKDYKLRPAYPAGYTGTWSIVATGVGVYFGDDSTNPVYTTTDANATVHGLTSTGYQLKWHVTDGLQGGCYDDDYLTLTNDKKEPTAWTVKNYSCEANIAIDGSDFKSSDPNVEQYWTTTDPKNGVERSFVNGSDSHSNTYGPLENGASVTLTWNVKSANAADCISSYDITVTTAISYCLPIVLLHLAAKTKVYTNLHLISWIMLPTMPTNTHL